MTCDGDAKPPQDASTVRSYWADAGGDISLPALAPIRSLTEEEWNRAVDRLEDDGLTSLTPDDRRSVLSGAIKAYLIASREVSLHVEITAPQGVLSAEVRETYSQDETGLYTIIRTRSVRSVGGFVDTWGGGPLLSAEGPVESELTVETMDPYRIVYWSRETAESPWVCQVSNDGAGLAGAVLAHFGFVTGVIDGSVTEVTDDAYKLVTQRGRENLQYLLDSDTLWPKEMTVGAVNDGITDYPEARYLLSSDSEFEAVQPPAEGC